MSRLPDAGRPHSAGASLPCGVLCALVLGGAGVLLIQQTLHRTGLVDVSWLHEVRVRVDQASPAAWTVPVGIVLAVLGLVVMVLGVWPGRTRQVPLHASSTDLWVGPRDIARLASAAAEDVPGVFSAQSQTGRGSVEVTVAVTGDDAALAEQVRESVTARLGLLEPQPRVEVRARREA